MSHLELTGHCYLAFTFPIFILRLVTNVTGSILFPLVAYHSPIVRFYS